MGNAATTRKLRTGRLAALLAALTLNNYKFVGNMKPVEYVRKVHQKLIRLNIKTISVSERSRMLSKYTNDLIKGLARLRNQLGRLDKNKK